MRSLPQPESVTLGVLAGGRATRLGGRDKAWLVSEGQPQVLRLVAALCSGSASPPGPPCAAVLVSANRHGERYAAHGLSTVVDRRPGWGPLGGLEALALACDTPWLATVPVDLRQVPADLVRRLAAAAAPAGACARDADGLQPLVALWNVERLRDAVAAAIGRDARAVHDIVARMGLAVVGFADLRFGNLNTPDDLQAAGIGPDD